jgi:hypothetical protein
MFGFTFYTITHLCGVYIKFPLWVLLVQINNFHAANCKLGTGTDLVSEMVVGFQCLGGWGRAGGGVGPSTLKGKSLLFLASVNNGCIIYATGSFASCSILTVNG